MRVLLFYATTLFSIAEYNCKQFLILKEMTNRYIRKTILSIAPVDYIFNIY